MAPIAIHTINLDTKAYQSDMSETPSPDGPLLAIPSSKKSSTISTTWLKLNSAAPIQVEVKEFPDSPAFHDEPFSGAKKLRHLIENTDELVVCPGVYDGLSARTAMELGFKSLYMVSGYVPFLVNDRMIMVSWQLGYLETIIADKTSCYSSQTGAGTTASRLGQPDLAIAQLADMRDNADMIANLDPFGPPLIADMDTGYGGKSPVGPQAAPLPSAFLANSFCIHVHRTHILN